MAATDVNLGKNGKVVIDTHTIARVSDWTLDREVENIEITAMGSTSREYCQKFQNWNASFSTSLVTTDPGQEALWAATDTAVAIKVYPNGEATGEYVYEGNAIVESISKSGSNDGVVTMSVSLRGTGDLVQNVVA